MTRVLCRPAATPSHRWSHRRDVVTRTCHPSHLFTREQRGAGVGWGGKRHGLCVVDAASYSVDSNGALWKALEAVEPRALLLWKVGHSVLMLRHILQRPSSDHCLTTRENVGYLAVLADLSRPPQLSPTHIRQLFLRKTTFIQRPTDPATHPPTGPEPKRLRGNGAKGGFQMSWQKRLPAIKRAFEGALAGGHEMVGGPLGADRSGWGG